MSVDILTGIRQKVYSLVEDFEQKGIELFTYGISNVFTIAQQSVTISQVLQNGIVVPTNKWSFNSIVNKLTVTSTLLVGDIIEVDYKYFQYTDAEINGYLQSAMVWYSVYSHNPKNFELASDGTTIEPTPDSQECDLLALIASILLKPDYTSYRLPNLTVTYRRELPRYERIEKLMAKWESCVGITDVLQFNIYIY